MLKEAAVQAAGPKDDGWKLVTLRPWADPVLDALGHDPRSAYAELFWLGFLGPASLFVLRRLVTVLDEAPPGANGVAVPVDDLARSVGLRGRRGGASYLGRALDRLGHFELARSDAAGALEVRRRLAPLTSVQVNRMPAALRAEHQRWQEDRPAGVDALRRRSRQLALSLVELGEDRDATERQLLRWRYHPALAHESSEWAWRRHELAARAAQDGTPAAPGGPQPPGPKESSISTRVRTPKPVAPLVV